MKANSMKLFQKMSAEELDKEVKNLQESLLKLRFKKVVEELKDTSQAKKIKKQIAQIKTLLRQQELQK